MNPLAETLGQGSSAGFRKIEQVIDVGSSEERNTRLGSLRGKPIREFAARLITCLSPCPFEEFKWFLDFIGGWWARTRPHAVVDGMSDRRRKVGTAEPNVRQLDTEPNRLPIHICTGARFYPRTLRINLWAGLCREATTLRLDAKKNSGLAEG